MPLPMPVAEREATHTRDIHIQGYRRVDGLWDVEGHLTDVRAQDVTFPGGGCRPAGQFIHSMWLRLTVDEAARIRAAIAVTDESPFPGTCERIAPNYDALVGLRVGPGFRGEIRRLFGGLRGCTHLTELISAMATGVFQTLAGEVPQHESQRPFSLDGCHAQATDGPIVAAFYPRWFRKPGGSAEMDSTDPKAT